MKIRSDIWEGNVKDDLTITMGKKLKLMPDNLEVAWRLLVGNWTSLLVAIPLGERCACMAVMANGVRGICVRSKDG